MIVYVAGRQQGKTTAIVRWLLEDPQHRCILVGDQERKKHIMRFLYRFAPIRDKKFWEDRIFLAAPIHFQQRGYLAREIGIDDLEYVLGILFRSEVQFVTTTATPLGPGLRDTFEDFGDYIDGEAAWADDTLEIEGRRAIDGGPYYRS